MWMQSIRDPVRLGSRPMRRCSLGNAPWAIGLVLASLALVCCQKSGQSRPLEASARSRLAVHVASTETSGDLTVQKIGPDGQSLFLATTPILTEADVLHASFSTAADGRPALVLDVSEGGAARLRGEAEAYVGRFLAFLWNEQVVYCPRVQSPLGSKLMLVGGTDVLPSDVLHEIADTINAAASEGGRDK
jgi:hypothetical protein